MTDTTKITDELFLSTLKDVVKENPDYVYAEDEKSKDVYGDSLCVYFYPEDGKPACVVGHVFDRLGVSPDVVMAQNGMPFGFNYFRNLFSGLSSGFIERVGVVQKGQDEGETWAEAYRKGMECQTQHQRFLIW